MTALEDKFAIQERLWAYLFTLDAADDVAGLRSFFTHDAIWEAFRPGADEPCLRLKTAEEVERVLAALRHDSRGLRLRHHLSGLVFDVLTDVRARTRAKILITASSSSELRATVHGTAIGEGEWEKNARGWKLRHWSLRPDTEGGLGQTPT